VGGQSGGEEFEAHDLRAEVRELDSDRGERFAGVGRGAVEVEGFAGGESDAELVGFHGDDFLAGDESALRESLGSRAKVTEAEAEARRIV